MYIFSVGLHNIFNYLNMYKATVRCRNIGCRQCFPDKNIYIRRTMIFSNGINKTQFK